MIEFVKPSLDEKFNATISKNKIFGHRCEISLRNRILSVRKKKENGW